MNIGDRIRPNREHPKWKKHWEGLWRNQCKNKEGEDVYGTVVRRSKYALWLIIKWDTTQEYGYPIEALIRIVRVESKVTIV